MSMPEGQIVTWGAVASSTLTGPAMGYELLADSIILQSRPHSFQRIPTTDMPTMQQSDDSDP